MKQPIKSNSYLIGLLAEFSHYYKILIVGFIGGILAWIFSFTFEDLLRQTNKFWVTFFFSLFIALIWSFLFALLSFILFKLIGMKFKDL